MANSGEKSVLWVPFIDMLPRKLFLSLVQIFWKKKSTWIEALWKLANVHLYYPFSTFLSTQMRNSSRHKCIKCINTWVSVICVLFWFLMNSLSFFFYRVFYRNFWHFSIETKKQLLKGNRNEKYFWGVIKILKKHFWGEFGTNIESFVLNLELKSNFLVNFELKKNF